MLIDATRKKPRTEKSTNSGVRRPMMVASSGEGKRDLGKGAGRPVLVFGFDFGFWINDTGLSKQAKHFYCVLNCADVYYRKGNMLCVLCME